MRQRKNSFRHESLQDAKSIQDVLHAVAEGIAKGRVVLSDDEDKMKMTPEGLLHLKLTASQEDGRNRIAVRVTWDSPDKKVKKDKTLSVSSK